MSLSSLAILSKSLVFENISRFQPKDQVWRFWERIRGHSSRTKRETFSFA